MARPMTWAIRVTFANGRDAFVRHGWVIGRGPIATYRTREQADKDADFVRQGLDAGDTVMVIERSHGRQSPAAGRSSLPDEQTRVPSAGEPKTPRITPKAS